MHFGIETIFAEPFIALFNIYFKSIETLLNYSALEVEDKYTENMTLSYSLIISMSSPLRVSPNLIMIDEDSGIPLLWQGK